MKTGSTLQTAMPALRALGVAAVLACAAGAATAADATLSIAWFGASPEAYSGNYVVATNPYQSFSMVAVSAGGSPVSDIFSANDWDQGLNRLAQSGASTASGNTVPFTDSATQLTTAGFNLSATTQGSGPLSSSANATGVQSGGFTLITGDGLSTAGSITFDIYYDMSVARPSGSSSNYASTVFSLIASSTSGPSQTFTDGLLSSNFTSGSSATSGHFSWTVNLNAGETAYYTLTSSTIAAAVPEPASYALLGLGLAVVGAMARRRHTASSKV